ncbi:MAG: hydrolase [Archangium sp.]|nr:hydrolase [Archangium sp.]
MNRLVEAVEVPVSHGRLGAMFYVPSVCRGAVVVAHPSGIGRLGRRERFVASAVANAGFATLLVDLLTEDEDAVREGAHTDVPMLADRLLSAARWLSAQSACRLLPIGYLGVGGSAAAALVATAMEPDRARAVVSRDGRPDLAGASLLLTRVPSLFIVAGDDPLTLAASRAACGHSPEWRLEVVPSSTGSDDGEALNRVAALSTAWFTHWLDDLKAPNSARCA